MRQLGHDTMNRRMRDVVRAPARVIDRPFVHPWMQADPDVVEHAVDRLDELLPRMVSALEATCVDAVSSSDLITVVQLLRTALAELADCMNEHVPAIRELRGAGPLRLRELRRHTDALSESDLACRRAFEQAREVLPERVDVLRGVTGSYAPTQAEQPHTQLSTSNSEAIRTALASIPPARLQVVLARRPDLAAVLSGDDDPPAWLALTVQSDAPADSIHQVAAVKARCASVGREQVTRAALLHPRVVGRLDGIPLWSRMLANRSLLRAELERCRHADSEYEARQHARRAQESESPLRRVQGHLLDTWLAREEITSFVTVPHDRPLALRTDLRARVVHYQRLLHDRVSQGRVSQGRVSQGRAGVRHRQVLLFDGEGPGRMVEMWGLLDDATRNVAVYVGGAGTTAHQFGWPTGIGQALARADATGHTAVIAWMGAEFPSAIASHAPFARYARDAGRPLRDHVEALDVPPGVPITLVGHSYGGAIVGAAERLGVRADRVVYAGAPGAGPGVRDVQDFPVIDPYGRPRDVARYALTAPGDLIRLWQRSDAPARVLGTAAARRVGGWLVDHTLGADPTRLAGVAILDTGVWEVDREDRRTGEILFGPRGHADVVEPGTTSFRRIVAVIQGRDPATIVPPAGVEPFLFRGQGRQ